MTKTRYPLALKITAVFLHEKPFPFDQDWGTTESLTPEAEPIQKWLIGHLYLPSGNQTWQLGNLLEIRVSLGK